MNLSSAVIAGIVIAVVACAALLALACFYWWRWRNNRTRGSFTSLRKGKSNVDPDEEFVSQGPSVRSRERAYRHQHQPSTSFEPLLVHVPSPPQTHLYLSSPDTQYLSLYEPDDPYSRIERAILPPHHLVSSRRVPYELDHPRHSSSAPLFINRIPARLSGPDTPPTWSASSLFLPVDPPRTGTDPLSTWTGDISQSRSLAETPPHPHTAPHEPFDAHVYETASEPTFSQILAPPPPDLQSSTTEIQLRTYSKPPKSSEPRLSPVNEAPTSTSTSSSSHNSLPTPQFTPNPSLSLPQLKKTSSLSVALSHAPPDASTFPSPFPPLPLLSSNNAFGKSGSGSGSHSSSQGRTHSSGSRTTRTRYPSLAGPSSSSSNSNSNSNSNRHSDSAIEWYRPPAGLAGLKNLQLEPPTQTQTQSPTSHLPPEIPDALRPHRPSSLLLANDTKNHNVASHKAHLRAHCPGSVAEIERRSVVQGGIASIDLVL